MEKRDLVNLTKEEEKGLSEVIKALDKVGIKAGTDYTIKVLHNDEKEDTDIEKSIPKPVFIFEDNHIYTKNGIVTNQATDINDTFNTIYDNIKDLSKTGDVGVRGDIKSAIYENILGMFKIAIQSRTMMLIDQTIDMIYKYAPNNYNGDKVIDDYVCSLIDSLHNIIVIPHYMVDKNQTSNHITENIPTIYSVFHREANYLYNDTYTNILLYAINECKTKEEIDTIIYEFSELFTQYMEDSVSELASLIANIYNRPDDTAELIELKRMYDKTVFGISKDND